MWRGLDEQVTACRVDRALRHRRAGCGADHSPARRRPARLAGIGSGSGEPVLRAGQVADGVTHQAAMNALRRLQSLGLLTARSDRGRITFRADEVVGLLGRSRRLRRALTCQTTEGGR
jgi:hypothetical protein